MSWCVDHGIAYSQFLAWQSGDVDLVRATLVERALTCPECGTRDDQWGERDARGVLKPFPTKPYVARTHECQGCKAAEQRMSSEPKGLGPGVKVRLVKPEEV